MRLNLLFLAGIIFLSGGMQLYLHQTLLGWALIALAVVMIPLHIRRTRQWREFDRKKAQVAAFGDDQKPDA